MCFGNGTTASHGLLSVITSKPITETQGTLFNRHNHFLGGLNHGRVRYVVGELFENLTAMTLNGRRHKCSGTGTYCPDVSLFNEAVYLEVKAVGKSGTAFIYEGRIEKDSEFAKSNLLSYCFWHHKADCRLPDNADDLIGEVLGSLQWMAVVPWPVVKSIVMQSEEKLLNSGYGGTDKKTYGSGRRLAINKLEKWKCLTVTTQMADCLRKKYYDCYDLASIGSILRQEMSTGSMEINLNHRDPEQI